MQFGVNIKVGGIPTKVKAYLCSIIDAYASRK